MGHDVVVAKDAVPITHDCKLGHLEIAGVSRSHAPDLGWRRDAVGVGCEKKTKSAGPKKSKLLNSQ